MEAYFWIVFFMIFPHANLGLLSDYKICGDPECDSAMSRVQAIKNHQGKDCRFLNFKKGDIIFVNHKLTGKREDLWAGSIDKHFGYFPKDSVEVEEVFAETEKVLETQESDFFCMDESGYPIDTTNLDSDDYNSQTQEPESTQTSTNTLDKNAQAPLMSTEATVKERDNEDGSKDLVDAAEQLRDELKASATPEEQGGSPSSSWLRSSVTGWLGFGKEEQLRDSEQGEKEDEKEETKPEASIRSSVTGWLGFGGEGKHDSDEDHVEIQEDSLTSTMTRWLGFSEGTETAAIASEEITETANEKEPTEMFRSRRMSLDLEGSKLQEEEEKEDMGTLAWLGSRLSSRLGLGSSPQDSGGEGKETEDQVASSSWMEMRTEGIFGFDDSKSGAGGSTGNGIKETETDQTLEEPPGLENIHIAQSEGSLSEETEKESQIKELENESKPPDSNDGGDTVDSYVDNSDTNEVNILETDVEVSNKDVVGENDIRSQEIDRSLKELDSNSMEQLEGRVEQEGKSLTEGGADVKEQLHTHEESTLMSENSPVRSDDQKEEQLTTEEGLFQQGLLKEESPEETEVSGDQGENDEQSKAETESRQGELELQLEMHPTEVSSQNDGSSFYENPESIYDNISEDDGVKMTLNKTTQTVHETPGFLQTENKEQRDRDVERLEEIVKDQTKLNEKEKTHSEKEVFNESEIKSVVGFETETEVTKGSKEEEKLKVKIQEEIKEVEEKIEEVKQESQQKQLEEIKKIEKKKEEELDSVSGEARGLIEERQDEVKELNEGEKWESVDHEQDRGSKEANEKALNQEKMAEISGDSPSEEFRVERQMDMQEEDKQVPEHGNHIRVEELKESERQNEKEEKGNFSGEGDTKFEEEMQKEAEELKEEEIHENGSQEHEEPILEIPKEFKDPNEKQKEEKEKVWGERNREGGKEITEQTQNEDFEPMEEEKTVKNSVELGNHVKVDEFKEYEQNENQEKGDKEQRQSEHEIDNTKEMLGDSNFAFLVSEANKKTENQNENEEVKVNETFTEPDKEHPLQEVKDGNVNVGGSEDGGWKDGNWKEDIGFEEEIKKTDNKNSGNEFHRDIGGEESYNPTESQVQGSEQSESAHPPLGINDKSQERVGAFGLLKNAIELFSQTPNPEMNESTQTVQSFNTNSAETTEPLASFTPGLDASTDSLHTEVTHTGFPKEQAQSHPISAEKLLHNAPSVTEAKTFSKDYKSLHHHMNADETVILLELFGRHKLQFLDYILTSPEAVSADEDQSILSDIEELLQHQMEMLVAPSMKGSDAPEEDKQRTSTIIALQKLETLLKSMKDTVSTGISDVSNHQAGPSSSRTNGNEDWSYLEKERDQGSKEKISLHNTKSGSKQKGLIKQSVEFLLWFAEESISSAKAVMGILVWITVQAVSLLPDNMRPGPDLYGVPWEPVIFTGLLGLLTFLLFTSRCYRSIKSRLYRRKEQRIAKQVEELLDEKCKVLETLSQCQQEYDDLENLLRDSGVLAQTQKSEHLEVQAEQLEQTKKQLGTDLDYLKEQLAQQQEHRKEQDRKITLLEESMKVCEAEAKDLQSKEEQAQTTLKIYSMSSERLQRNLETAEEENTVLQESNSQLKQEVEEWAERISELEAEMQRCEVAHSAMMQDVAVKDERITSLTDRLLQMKCWDSDLEEEEGGEKDTTNGTAGKEDTHLQKVQKLIFAAKLNADLKSVDEDKDRVFAKLNDEIKAKEDLRMSIEEMEREKLSLQSDTESYTDQVDRIQQKLQIMTEMYQENELKLHRMLTVEEKERHQKEEKLSKADKNIAMAIEELNNYRKRAEEMEEELEKTKQSYQTQISAHEKKAHNNWLAVRSAERELADIRRENALLRQKITDTQFKLDSLEKDPYALNSLARPLPFRAERSPYGPSPLSRPSSETRPFLSPPTLMDGLPGRLSPRVSRGPGEPPSGQADMERTGGPHSDSGSISPTWERDRRGPPPGPPGPLGPPGYIFPEPGGPILRRPPPGALGSFPPPGALPPGALPPRGFPLGPPHPLDMADGSFREGRQGPGDQDHRESGPGGQRTPPEMDPRMVGPPPPGPPGIPIDGPYPRRAPYGPPPPPDFYPPRIPGGPPMRHMWLPPPQGMMFPPRFPSGGPLPPGPNPNVPYGPPIQRPPYDGPPPPSMGAPPRQQSLPSPPHSQSPEENRPSPEDAI